MTTRTMLRLATLITPVMLAGCTGLTPDFGSEWTSRHFTDPYQVGKAQYAAGQYGLAVKSFQAAVDTDPGSVEALNALAASYDKLGRFDLSARYYGRALALAPKDTQTLNNIGYSYLLQKRYDLAVAYLRDAHSAAHDDPVVLANRKVAEVALQDADLERSRAAAIRDSSEDTAQASGGPATREQHSSAASPAKRGLNRSSSPERESVAAASPATRGPDRPWIERTAPQIQTLITEPQYAMTEEAEDAGVAPELANYKTPETVLPEALDAPIRDTAAVEPAPRVEGPVAPPVDSAARISRLSEPETPEPVQLAAVPRERVERVTLSAPRTAPESDAVERPEPEALQVAEARAPAPILGPRMAPVPIVPVQVTALPEPEASAAPAPDLGKSLTDEAIAPEPRTQVAALTDAAHRESRQGPVRPARRVSGEAPADGSSESPPEPTAILPLLEVSNGAGRLRMAARMRAHLQAEGITVGRLTNADHFRHMETTIFYRDGWLAYAERLARFLPAVVDLRAQSDQRSDIRIELGGDLLEFDRELYYADRRPVDGRSG